MPQRSADQLHSRLRQAGLSFSESEAAAVAPAWKRLQAWLDVLRRPALPPEAEPATTFAAERGE